MPAAALLSTTCSYSHTACESGCLSIWDHPEGWTPNLDLRTSDLRPGTSDLGPRTPDLGSGPPDLDLDPSDPGTRDPGSGPSHPETTGFRRVPGPPIPLVAV